MKRGRTKRADITKKEGELEEIPLLEIELLIGIFLSFFSDLVHIVA